MKKCLTLIELLLGAGILVFVFSGMFLLFAKCIILNEASRSLTLATGHTQIVMEEIKAATFSAVAARIKAPNNEWDWDITDLQNKGLIPLTNEAIDTSVDDTNPDLLIVTVSGSWDDREGRNNAANPLIIETLLSKP